MIDREKPNLLILTSSFPRNQGDETCGYIRDFARSAASEFNVTVLTLPERENSDWPDDKFKLFRASSLPGRINPLQAGSDLTHLSSQSLLTKLAALISLIGFTFHALRLARHADVICSHWMLPSGLIGSITSRLTGKPHIIVEHSGALHLLKQMRGGGRLADFIINGSCRVITVSRDLKAKLLELCPDASQKTEVIPMGVDVAGIAPAQKAVAGESISVGGRTILFVGRLTAIKGIEILLKAAKGIDNLRCVIAGDGDERERLEKIAVLLEIKATFLGRVNAEDRNDLLRRCDAVVIPSLMLPDGRTEGMPVICLEAMAAERPVIASRTGGLAELIQDGHNGLLFDPGNHSMLAERLHLLMNDSGLRDKLAANARSTVAEYDWSLVGLKYCEILKGSLQQEEILCH